MLRNFTVGLLVVSLALSVVIAVRSDTSPTQSSENKIVQPPAEGLGDANNLPIRQANPLPISQVVLFNSGVGYFHRTGIVEGDARVDLQFPTGDINDLIKSLVIHDTKGKIAPVRYDSQEPIEKTLRSFAINLSSNPSYGEILNQARGEKVELTLVANNTGLPGTLQGTIIGMESGHRLPTPTAVATADMEVVNVMCAEGLRSVPLTQIQRLRFLNPAIENELRRALEVVASGHDSQKKSVRLGFRGEGKREVNVGYVTENPIWKTSYRIVIDKEGKTKLLGWANVENTSDEDWHNVKLTLVSGRPISFQMDLYPPLFIPRPTVEPELFASLRPPTYAGSMTNQFSFGQGGAFGAGAAGGLYNGGGPVVFNGNFGGVGFAGFAGGGGGANGNFGGFNGNFGGQRGGVDPPMDGVSTPAQSQFGFQGFNGFNANQTPINRYQNRTDNNNLSNQKLGFTELQKRRNNKERSQEQSVQQAKQVGSILTTVDPDLIDAALTAEDLGNPARFVIDEKVSLPRQQSAMIPILDQSIDVARVSIYNQSVQAKHPLTGLKIKNNSKQALMQGPIAVYDDDQYAGDARILDLQPGEERYVSYAIDTGAEIAPFDTAVRSPEMAVRMLDGKLQVQYKVRSTRTYVIKNRSPFARKIVVEQPVQEGWRFTEARKLVQIAPGKKGDDGIEQDAAWKRGDIENPSERTRDLYRFVVDVKAGEMVKYEVSEEQPRRDPFESTKQADWTGFATTLGLDVWTDAKRTPEDAFGLRMLANGLKVTHKDRRTTTYFLRNRTDAERRILLEHFVPNERRLLGDVKPAVAGTQRYRFELVLPPGKTLSQTVVEESAEARSEVVALKTGIDPNQRLIVGAVDLPADRHITDLGFEVWQNREALAVALTDARFIAGELYTASRERDSVKYHVRNLAPENRVFHLDHDVSPQWSFAGDEKPVEGSRNCYRFVLTASQNKIASREVIEERTTTRKESLNDMTEERAKVLLESPAVPAAVKASILKGRSLLKDLAQGDAALKELRAQLTEITDEQARIKSNFDKLPPTSELYKRLIDKFDKQESALESAQKQNAEKLSQRKQLRADYERFLEKLTVE